MKFARFLGLFLIVSTAFADCRDCHPDSPSFRVKDLLAYKQGVARGEISCDVLPEALDAIAYMDSRFDDLNELKGQLEERGADVSGIEKRMEAARKDYDKFLKSSVSSLQQVKEAQAKILENLRKAFVRVNAIRTDFKRRNFFGAVVIATLAVIFSFFYGYLRLIAAEERARESAEEQGQQEG